MTFTDLYTVWDAEKRNTLNPMSYSTYTVLLERFILPRLGDNEAITEEDVDASLRNHTHQYLPVRLLLQEGPTARHRAADGIVRGTMTDIRTRIRRMDLSIRWIFAIFIVQSSYCKVSLRRSTYK